MSTPARRRVKGVGKEATQFKAGKSGNPQGWTKKAREQRAEVKRIFEEASIVVDENDGERRDLLIESIRANLFKHDTTITKMVAEYRYGKPTTDINLHATVAAVSPEDMSDSELVAYIAANDDAEES